jgi:hypothetical protein
VTPASEQGQPEGTTVPADDGCHNIGGNTSQAVRCAVYFRIKRAGHDPRWREFLQDPWFDYDAVRERLE